MGNGSKKDLSPELEERIVEIFKQIDTDGSKTIDKQETLSWWGGKFAKINAEAMFQEVDKNGDEEITLVEWVEFWKAVKGAGHSENEIIEEIENLESKESWVHFTGVGTKVKGTKTKSNI